MELHDIPRIMVLNKWDATDPDTRLALREAWPEALSVSAVMGEGLDTLSQTIENTIRWEGYRRPEPTS